MAFIETQQLPAGWRIVIDYIEGFPIDASRQAGEDNSVSAVVNVGQGYRVRPTKMEKDSKCADPHTAGDVLFAGTVNRTGPDDNVRDPECVAVLTDDLVLFDLREAIRIAPGLAMLLNRRGLIQQPPAGFPCVRIDSEGADIDEPPQARVLEA
jgi:hypothetical protein